MMRRIISSILLMNLSFSTFANESADLVKASYAYGNNKEKQLAMFYGSSHNQPVIAYLYAKFSLNNKDNPIYAENYVQHMHNGYMKNDIIHQLLIFYYNRLSYTKYSHAYNQFINTQISVNETCGYDVANIKINPQANSTTDLNWLANDNITSWCADLGALEFKQNNLSKLAFNRILSNLLIYGDLNSFNDIAPQFGIAPIDFNKYNHASYSKIPKNQYLLIYNISRSAKKYPTEALILLERSRLDKQNKTLLGNYIALQFATQQHFTTAIGLFEKYHSNNISSDEFEWRARSYIATANGDKLINAIKSMPLNLQNKNVWRYWIAKAYADKRQYNKAEHILQLIPKDYSYYYLLAQGELGKVIKFNTTLPNAANLGNDDFADQVETSLYLYQLGISNNSKSISNIGVFQWYYLTRIATPTQLVAMSIIARNEGYYDLSINAANKLSNKILYLSFPTPYLSYYNKFSQLMGISNSYALAISRQESRFNTSIIAFDGGEGLMQIMPETAKYISKKSKYTLCSRLNAQCNIKYGTWYLGNLYAKFGSYIYASAGYNGGPNRAKRWQANLKGLDNRVQLEMIPISITRDYVQKILTNKAIYEAKLNGSNQINMLSYVINLKETTHNINNLGDDDTDAGKI